MYSMYALKQLASQTLYEKKENDWAMKSQIFNMSLNLDKITAIQFLFNINAHIQNIKDNHILTKSMLISMTFI